MVRMPIAIPAGTTFCFNRLSDTLKNKQPLGVPNLFVFQILMTFPTTYIGIPSEEDVNMPCFGFPLGDGLLTQQKRLPIGSLLIAVLSSIMRWPKQMRWHHHRRCRCLLHRFCRCFVSRRGSRSPKCAHRCIQGDVQSKPHRR